MLKFNKHDYNFGNNNILESNEICNQSFKDKGILKDDTFFSRKLYPIKRIFTKSYISRNRFKIKNSMNKPLPYVHIEFCADYTNLELNPLILKRKYKYYLESIYKNKIILNKLKDFNEVTSKKNLRSQKKDLNKNDQIFLFKERKDFFKYIFKHPLFKLYLFFFKENKNVKVNIYLNYPFSSNNFKLVIIKITFSHICIFINNPFNKKIYKINIIDSNSIFYDCFFGDIYI